MGFSGKDKGAAQGGRAPPPPLVLLGLGEVAGPPLSLSPSGNPSPTRIPRRGKEEEGAGHLS